MVPCFRGKILPFYSSLFYYTSRIVLAVCLLFLYLYAIRPARKTFVQQAALPMVTPHYDNLSTPFTIVNKGTALTFTFTWHGEKKTTRYQPQLGFFFLIAIMALPFIALRPKWYMALAAFHILAMLLVAAILYFSRFGWYPGFIIIDFLVSYLIPGLTFIYVVVVLNLETDYSLLQKVNTYSLPKTR